MVLSSNDELFENYVFKIIDQFINELSRLGFKVILADFSSSAYKCQKSTYKFFTAWQTDIIESVQSNLVRAWELYLNTEAQKHKSEVATMEVIST